MYVCSDTLIYSNVYMLSLNEEQNTYRIYTTARKYASIHFYKWIQNTPCTAPNKTTYKTIFCFLSLSNVKDFLHF